MVEVLDLCLWTLSTALDGKYYTHYYGCSHHDDVGVQCAPGDIINLLVECTESKGMEQERDFHLCHLQLAVPMISSD